MHDRRIRRRDGFAFASIHLDDAAFEHQQSCDHLLVSRAEAQHALDILCRDRLVELRGQHHIGPVFDIALFKHVNDGLDQDFLVAVQTHMLEQGRDAPCKGVAFQEIGIGIESHRVFIGARLYNLASEVVIPSHAALVEVRVEQPPRSQASAYRLAHNSEGLRNRLLLGCCFNILGQAAL